MKCEKCDNELTYKDLSPTGDLLFSDNNIYCTECYQHEFGFQILEEL